MLTSLDSTDVFLATAVAQQCLDGRQWNHHARTYSAAACFLQQLCHAGKLTASLLGLNRGSSDS